MENQKYDSIIVGGGIAGVTSAVYLARAGQKVLLIEKNSEFGGLVSTFVRDGFHFEAGVRALESAGIILPMLEDLGIQLELIRSKVSVGVEDQMVSIDDLDSIGNYRDMLVKLYPESEEETDRFIDSMRQIMKYLEILYGIENPAFKDLKKDKKYIFRKLLPWLPKFLLTVGKINRLNMPIEGYLKEKIKNSALRDIISQHFFKGTPTFFALSYFSLYLDYFYPKGGVGKLVEALESKIHEFGGELKPNTSIVEVNASDQFVVDQNQVKYEYKHLIWAADLKTFYNLTQTKSLSSKIQEKFQIRKKEIMAGSGSESVFSLYLEVDLPISYFKNIANGHIFYTPSRIGLKEIHREELGSLLANWQNDSKEIIMEWLDRFLTLNTYEISIPGIKDESLVPPNKTGMIVSFIIEYELFKKAQETDWYDEFLSTMQTKMIHVLSNSIFPELSEHIEKQFTFTPLSYKNRISSSDGAIVGWSMASKIPVEYKIQNSAKSVLTPIPNIFQAGQWSYSPAGVPMSILTGKLAADRVIKNS